MTLSRIKGALPTPDGHERPARSRRRHLRRSGCLAAVVSAALVIGACGSTSGSGTTVSPTSGGASAITIAASAKPLSLDPALENNTVDQIAIMDLAYEPLIVLNPDGTLGPGLATSWKYTNRSLTAFELRLRPGVKFSDGTPLTAAAVVASLHHETATNGPTNVYIKDISSAAAAGPLTVRLHLAQTNPDIAFLLTNRFLIGDIIGTRAASHPSMLGTSTDGAGPYELNTSATVAGSRYVFEPNPYYYDKSQIHFKTFTVEIITNPQTALNALQSGQIAYADGSFSSASAAKSSGLRVYAAPYGWAGLTLLDRDGALVPALHSQLVRQALNYAIDRAGISTAIYGQYGTANDEVALPGYETEGFDPGYVNHYAFDASRARALLKQAGYPNGFTMTIGASPDFAHGVDIAQAVANDWAKIGVKTNIKTYPSLTQLVAAWSAKQLPATAGDYGGQPLFVESGQLLAKNAGLYNPFQNTDATLTSLIAKASAATTKSAIASDWAAVTRRVVDLGWEFPITTESQVFFARPALKGVALSATSFAPNPTLWSY